MSDLHKMMAEKLSDKDLKKIAAVFKMAQSWAEDEDEDILSDVKQGVDNLIYNAQAIRKALDDQEN